MVESNRFRSMAIQTEQQRLRELQRLDAEFESAKKTIEAQATLIADLTARVVALENA